MFEGKIGQVLEFAFVYAVHSIAAKKQENFLSVRCNGAVGAAGRIDSLVVQVLND